MSGGPVVIGIGDDIKGPRLRHDAVVNARRHQGQGMHSAMTYSQRRPASAPSQGEPLFSSMNSNLFQELGDAKQTQYRASKTSSSQLSLRLFQEWSQKPRQINAELAELAWLACSHKMSQTEPLFLNRIKSPRRSTQFRWQQRLQSIRRTRRWQLSYRASNQKLATMPS